jgi:hypothetical protein
MRTDKTTEPLVINLLIELLAFLSGYIHVTIVKHLPSLQLQVFIMSMFTSRITQLSASSLSTCVCLPRMQPARLMQYLFADMSWSWLIIEWGRNIFYIYICVYVCVCGDQMFPPQRQGLYKQQCILHPKTRVYIPWSYLEARICYPLMLNSYMG